MLHGGTSAATLLPVTGYVSLCTQAIERQTMADIERWRVHLAESREDIRRVLENTRRIAVLGMKPDFTGQPAYYVPEYAKRSGYEVIPVLLGEPVYRRLADVPGQIDMVNVFRRAHDIPPHVDDILAARPKSVWFQLGIRNNEVAERLAKEGIDVVQDRCLLVELNAIGR
jgi:uncharacterized protein